MLATALAIALNDQAVCCGKNSALADVLLSEPQSLRELGIKLPGRYFLSDDKPIVVRTEYMAQASINSGYLINSLLAQQASLIEWSLTYTYCPERSSMRLAITVERGPMPF
jgi:hypothetical protein